MLAYNIAAIWFISAVWLVLSWLITFTTKSGMVAMMVLPIINAAMFVVVVSVVSVSSSTANTLYILWDVGMYPYCPAVLQSCCARMRLVYATAMKILKVGYIFGSLDGNVGDMLATRWRRVKKLPNLG